ncbi:MAG: 4Fe-4S binding protein [Deltaproteobacteria bacterium]|nr:4Fe-4S binding protein [Deltaproteobacteria bacterium]
MFEAIQTIKQNCRRCFTCVRDCPVKAIKIVEGQASVVPDRCIACGNCTMVCSQDAKTYASGLERTGELLESGRPVAALLAPSFPGEFPDLKPGQISGALKRAGFSYVVEVAYGADLVSEAYREFLKQHPEGGWIASACPAVNEYVRKYQPKLVGRLLPIVSPMIATAMALRQLCTEEILCVFIGPCIAKKLEARDPGAPAVIDEVLTFKELRALFTQRGILPAKTEPQPFDPPTAGMGRAFPLSGGLLKSAKLEADLLDPRIITISGQQEVTDILGATARGEIEPFLIEPLMCQGCHDGPGMSRGADRHNRKDFVRRYVNDCRQRASGACHEEPERIQETHIAPSLNRSFTVDDHRLQEPSEQEIRAILARTNKFLPGDELNCKACGYDTCRTKAIAVHHGLAEEAMCLPFMIEQAERVCSELQIPWQEIRKVHRHLINTEKLASMGQLAAGVAHELNNPLGTILLYTNLLQRKIKDRDDLDHDLNLLVEEARRCKKIVGGLLDFARQNRVRMEVVNMGELIRHILSTSFQLPKIAEKGIQVIYEDGTPDITADVDRDQMTQVMVNLIKNAVEAMDGKSGEVRIKVEETADTGRLHISVSDQGCGIKAEDRERVFQPFFTTKSIGKGVGLGLPICYGIVKMHRGTIWYDSTVASGTQFHIELPKTQAMAGRSMLS